MNIEELLLNCVEKEVKDGAEKASERVQKSLAHISDREIPFMIAIMEKYWLEGKMADLIKTMTDTEITVRKEHE